MGTRQARKGLYLGEFQRGRSRPEGKKDFTIDSAKFMDCPSVGCDQGKWEENKIVPVPTG